MIRLALIEDDLLIQDSLNDFFSTQEHIDCILTSASVERFLESISELESIGHIWY